MVWIMLAITVVCVVIVFAIVMAQKEKGALVKQARAVTKDMMGWIKMHYFKGLL